MTTIDDLADHQHPDREHFDRLVGFDIDEVGPDRVAGHLVTEAKHQQPYGIVHGGVYAGIVETLASFGAAIWASEQEMIVVGVSNTTDFIRAHREGRLDAVGTPVHRGRSQQLWEVRITRASDGKLVARGQVCLQNLPAESASTVGRPAP